ncbi:MAG: hypothetical protein AAF754_17545, partial [Pseudomonadota bacterium]
VPSPVWTDLRDFVLEFGDRETWTAKVGFDADIDLNVEAVPLVSGATMIRFIQAPAMPVKNKAAAALPVERS